MNDANKQQPLKVLMINLPFSGHTNPTLELAGELVKRGCQVAYIQAPQWKERVLSTGAAFIPYDNYDEALSPSKKEFKSWSGAYNTALRVGGDFDCIIYEILFFPGKNLADKLKKPSIRLFSTFALNRRVIDDFGRTGGLYMTAVFRLKPLLRLLSSRLYKKYRLAYKDIVDELVLNGPELNFIYTLREFQIYNTDFPDSNYHFIGPSITARPTEIEIPFENIKNPLIYISLGTLINHSISFFRKCFKAFGKEEVTVILSIGKSIKKEDLGPIPPNFYVYPFVPQLEVLKHAALFITHGGMNSVNESLYFGVPMLVIPVGNDQPTVANRVEELGLGKRINNREATPEMLRKAAFSVLSDPGCKEELRKFRDLMRNSGGNALAADETIKYLNNSRQGPK